LHDALEALLADGGRDGRADVSAEEARLVETARWLWAAASAGAIAPRPTFVLGLEDQLRADRSLMGALTPAAPARRGATLRWSAVAALAVAVLGVGLLATQRAQPGQLLFPLRRAAESGQTALFAAGDRLAMHWLELGRQRMDDLRQGLDGRAHVVRSLIDDVVGAYTAALGASAQHDNDAVRRRVLDEAAAAARELDRLAAAAKDERPVVAVWLADASRLLERRVALGDRGAGQFAQPVRPRGQQDAAPTPSATLASISAAPVRPVPPGEPGGGASTPGPTAVTAPGATAVLVPGATAVVVTAEPGAGATALLTAEATPIVNPVTEVPPTARPRTETPRVPWVEPSATVVSQPSNTPDRWPETSTPPPATAAATLVPVATATSPAPVPPTAPSVAPPQPTAEPTGSEPTGSEPSARARAGAVTEPHRRRPAASGV